MKKTLLALLSSLAALSFFAMPAYAHRSGCHSWHSCPSDSGSYVCGDTGHCSACSDNQYCQNGSYSPSAARIAPVPSVQVPVAPSAPAPVVPVPSVPVVTHAPVVAKPVVKTPVYFVGVPKTYAQLLSCRVVGNGASKIYHLQGSQWIKTMNLKNKSCFGTETAAKAKGYRKSKT